MDSDAKQSLFQVYLRLRPAHQQASKNANEPWLFVEPPAEAVEAGQQTLPTHITLQPPNDSRKRAVEKFGFTKVFEEHASQLDIFEGAGTTQLLQGVLQNGRDGLLATLGVTGSGKSHTILGSRTQRGLTQMSLDMIFQSIGSKIRRIDHPEFPTDHNLLAALQASDPSEATLSSASSFLDAIYGEAERGRFSRAQTPMAGAFSRAQTPMNVRTPLPGASLSSPKGNSCISVLYPKLDSVLPRTRNSGEGSNSSSLPLSSEAVDPDPLLSSKRPFWNRSSFTRRSRNAKYSPVKDTQISIPSSRRLPMPRLSTMPHLPEVTNHFVDLDSSSEYAIIVSMYEVYNDRIFDLLSLSMSPNGGASSTKQATQLQKDLRRRPLLFKSTEMSPDRKVVAGLRKVICGSYEEAMMVLETGLTERRVAGTGSNSVSSRSHGFFCIEVKKQEGGRYGRGQWTSSTMSIVDLAGSERARSAKTTGSTLAEAGKINESLMYLGQCLQLQSGCNPDKHTVVPYRQCKLTELLFSNSFPTTTASQSSYRTPQKATMIVTADPQGDFNATSQILRYSALAREVTVPRIPSTTSQILDGSMTKPAHPDSLDRTQHTQELEMKLQFAITEIARLSTENDNLSIRLAEEEIKTTEISMALRAAEEKSLNMETEIRDECWMEMETRIEEEKVRYRQAWEQEKLKGEEFLDGKIDILERGGIAIAEDSTATTSDELLEEVSRENETLRMRLEALEREFQTRSPTKRATRSSTNGNTKTNRSPSKPLLATKENLNPSSKPTLFRDISLKAPLSSTTSTSPARNTRQSSSTSSSNQDSSSPLLNLKLEDLNLNEIHEAIEESKAAAAKAEQSKMVPGSTVKKQRKLTTRKWDLGGEENDVFG